MSRDDAVHAALSRELWLETDDAGQVTWADARALELLAARPGVALRTLAAPGTEDKLDRLVAMGQRGRVERWEVVLIARGTPVTLAFHAAPTSEGRVAMVASLVPEDYAASLGHVAESMSELSSLHRETTRQKHELQQRHAEILRLNRDLDDSGRGLVALHAELHEKSDSLRVASEAKSRVVANVSHEFRTPLNSILGLSRLLLSRVDGDLNEEQEKQIGFIRRSAEALSELVNDLLDMSKIDAGKVVLRTSEFSAEDLFGALRGMMKALAPAESGVALIFEDVSALPRMDSDEGKIAQVLRNFVSNALKFTERGEVRVGARVVGDDSVAFWVRDTGIGIAPEDQDRIFEEFTQIENPLQRRTKGSGLGLSLTRRLAALLGGDVTVQSEPGRGSCFTLTVPRVHPDAAEMAGLNNRSDVIDPSRAPVLVVEDDTQTLFLYEKYLSGSGFQVIPARSIEDARRALQRLTPAAVVLDVMLDGEATWSFLSEMKAQERTRDIPVLVVTVTSREQKARALGADEFYVKPIDQQWLLKKLQMLSKRGVVEKVLVIDDDEVARYLVRKTLAGLPYVVLEASGGEEGVRVARREIPDVIFLDFVMPDMSAFEVLDELKKDPITRRIPVIIHTSKNLAEDERRRLADDTAAILSKQSLSREVAIARIREALVNAGVSHGARA